MLRGLVLGAPGAVDMLMAPGPIRGFATARRNTVMRRAAKENAGTKREGHYKPPSPVRTWSIFRGDRVQLVAGEAKGAEGVVKRVDKDRGQVYLKNSLVFQDGEKRKKRPVIGVRVDYCQVKLIDPETKQPTRVRWRQNEDGEQVRYAMGTDKPVAVPVPSFKKTYGIQLTTARADAKRITYDKHPSFLQQKSGTN